MADIPLFTHFTAATELLVTAAVAWFFYHALRHQDYRFGVITSALVYETAFNISYMVLRIIQHNTAVDHPTWITSFVAAHGTLSLVMFLGLIGYVAWAFVRVRRGDPHPMGASPRLAAAFLVFWGLSILSGELIYVFQLTGVMHSH
jgi:hypothetical protein